MAELSVKLLADVKEILSALDTVKKELKETGVVSDDTAKKVQKLDGKKASKSIQQLGKTIDPTQRKIESLGTSILSSTLGVTTFAAAIGLGIAKLVEYVTELSDAEKTQRAFTQAISKGVGSVAAELATLRSLLSVARDDARSRQARQRAVEKINEEYKDYLPNLNLENVNTKKVTEAVDDLSKSLIRQAKIRGAQNLIAKETAKILELQEKNLLKEASTLDAIVGSLKGIGNAAGPAFNIIGESAKTQQKEISEAERRIASFTKTLQDLISLDVNLGGVFSSTKPGKTGGEKSIFANLINTEGLEGIATQAGETLQKALSAQQNKVRQGLGDLLTKPLEESVRIATPHLSNIENALIQFNQNVSDIIGGSIVSTFAGIGDAIGSALRTGENVFSAIGQSLLKSFGRFISEMGAALISYGLVAKQKGLLDIAIAAGGPFAIVAGAAAIKTGALLLAAGAAFGAIAGAGFGGGGGNAIAGQGSGPNTSFSGGVSNFSGDGTVVFEISGNSLIGVLNRSLGKNGRLGGNLSIG